MQQEFIYKTGSRLIPTSQPIWTAVTIMAMQSKAKKYIISHILDLRCSTLKPHRFDFVKPHSLAHRRQLGQYIPLQKEKVAFPRERCLFYKVTQTLMKAPSHDLITSHGPSLGIWCLHMSLGAYNLAVYDTWERNHCHALSLDSIWPWTWWTNTQLRESQVLSVPF